MYNQPFNPYGFQPGYQTGFQQPMSPMQAQRPPEITVAQVATVDQVEQVQMMPGDRKIILVQNAPIIAIRIADQMGLVQTEYRRTEVFDPRTQRQGPAQEYAPMALVLQMQEQLQAITGELSSMKGANNRGRSVKQSASAATDTPTAE